jgi:hypothetical protein
MGYLFKKGDKIEYFSANLIEKFTPKYYQQKA